MTTKKLTTNILLPYLMMDLKVNLDEEKVKFKPLMPKQRVACKNNYESIVIYIIE